MILHETEAILVNVPEFVVVKPYFLDLNVVKKEFEEVKEIWKKSKGTMMLFNNRIQSLEALAGRIENFLSQQNSRVQRATFLSGLFGIATSSDVKEAVGKLEHSYIAMDMHLNMNMRSLDINMNKLLNAEKMIVNATSLNFNMIMLQINLDNIENRLSIIYDICKSANRDVPLHFETVKNLNLTSQLLFNEFLVEKLDFSKGRISFNIFTTIRSEQKYGRLDNSECICDDRLPLCLFISKNYNREHTYEANVFTIYSEKVCRFVGIAKQNRFFAAEGTVETAISCYNELTNKSTRVVYQQDVNMTKIALNYATESKCNGTSIFKDGQIVKFVIGHPETRIRFTHEQEMIRTILEHSLRFPLSNIESTNFQLNPVDINMHSTPAANIDSKIDKIYEIVIIVNAAVTGFLILAKIAEMTLYGYIFRKK